jgi:hypothetical protein
VRRFILSARIAPCSETLRHAVRHACEIRDEGLVWRESFSAEAFLPITRAPAVTIGHDGERVGTVTVLLSQGAWHYAEAMIECSDEQAARIRVGQPVSIDATSIRRDDDAALGLRRHEIVRLDALALIDGERERPAYPGAKVVSINELRERRAKAIADLDLGSYQLQEGDVVLDHVRNTAHRFEGGRLVLQ